MDRIRGVAIVAMAGLALVALASFLLWKHGGELKNLREVFDRDGDGVVTEEDLPRDGAPGKDCDPQEFANLVFQDARFCEAVEACNAKTAVVASAKAQASAKAKRAPKVVKAKPVAPPPTRAAVTIITEATPGDGTVHLNRATAETPSGFRYKMTVETAVVK